MVQNCPDPYPHLKEPTFLFRITHVQLAQASATRTTNILNPGPFPFFFIRSLIWLGVGSWGGLVGHSRSFSLPSLLRTQRNEITPESLLSAGPLSAGAPLCVMIPILGGPTSPQPPTFSFSFFVFRFSYLICTYLPVSFLLSSYSFLSICRFVNITISEFDFKSYPILFFFCLGGDMRIEVYIRAHMYVWELTALFHMLSLYINKIYFDIPFISLSVLFFYFPVYSISLPHSWSTSLRTIHKTHQ